MNKKEWIQLNQMAFPILGHYFVTVLFEAMDQAIVGHYRTSALSAVGICASFIYVVTGAFGVLSNAYHIRAAEAIGKKDWVTFESLFTAFLKLAILLSMVWLGLSFGGGRWYLQSVLLLEGELLADCWAYFQPAAITVCINLVAFVCSVYFRNCHDTQRSFYFTVVSTVINLFFDYCLVYGRFGFREMGAAGAGWGSVIGLSCGLLVYGLPLRHHSFQHATVNWLSLIKLAVPLFIEEFLESMLFTFLLAPYCAQLGILGLAAYQLNHTLSGFLILIGYAYASASSTLIMQKAAEKRRMLSLACWTSSLLLGLFALVLLWAWSAYYAFFTADGAVMALAHDYLVWVILLAFFAILYQMFRYTLQGCGKAQETVIIMVLGNAMGFFLLHVFSGMTGIYLALLGREILCLGLGYWQFTQA